VQAQLEYSRALVSEHVDSVSAPRALT